MARLPSILSVRQRRARLDTPAGAGEENPSAKERPGAQGSVSTSSVSEADIKHATRVRKAFVTVASLSYLLAFVFLVLVLIGNTHDTPVLSKIYFYRLDLANIIPQSVANANLINSIAQSIGLHDFYQVGLWNFCEGYNNVGITYCSTPENLYWFNPVAVIMNELLAGATIALPNEVIEILNVLRIASQIMFGFFLTATVVNFVLIFASPAVLFSRWWSLPMALVAAIASVLAFTASIIGSVISFVFKYAAESQSDLNIGAEVGTEMLVFTWLASGLTLLAFIVHAGLGCCCTSRRDLQTGRREVRDRGVQEK